VEEKEGRGGETYNIYQRLLFPSLHNSLLKKGEVERKGRGDTLLFVLKLDCARIINAQTNEEEKKKKKKRGDFPLDFNNRDSISVAEGGKRRQPTKSIFPSMRDGTGGKEEKSPPSSRLHDRRRRGGRKRERANSLVFPYPPASLRT